MSVDVFDQIVTTENVEDAVIATVRLWADTYLSEVERQNGIAVPTLGRPASYQESYDTDNWPLEQLPGIVVVCPGTTGTLERQGNQQYGAWFAVGLAAVVQGQSQPEARAVGQQYQGAMNALLLQHGSLGGFATDTVLMNFTIQLQQVENRYVAVAISEFQVFVDSIYTASAGPVLPDPLKLTPDPNGPDGSTEGTYTGYPIASTARIEADEAESRLGLMTDPRLTTRPTLQTDGG